MIASVYLNRMAKNMPLEVDATVQYALGYDKTQQRWWPLITVDQFRTTESPYNTYLHRDLPPGPICSPGLASIQAVLQPAKSDYLFYFAKGDGSHVFAKTFEEHLQTSEVPEIAAACRTWLAAVSCRCRGRSVRRTPDSCGETCPRQQSTWRRVSTCPYRRARHVR